MKKLNCILLIDDDDADNEYHSIIIGEADAAYSVKNAESGKTAIKYLNSIRNKVDKYAIPELIFLDINMPGMNGFEFLEKCRDQHLLDAINPVIVMLTTSINPSDRKTARERFPNLIHGFYSKPLTEEILAGIMQKFFSGAIDGRMTDGGMMFSFL